MSKFVKRLFVVIGTINIVLGIIGIFLPIMPTVPFLLIAAVCYTKGSPKLYEWLISHKWLGRYIKDYMSGQGIPLKTKILACLMLWTSIICSSVFIVNYMWLRIIMITVAACVTWYILSLKTKQAQE